MCVSIVGGEGQIKCAINNVLEHGWETMERDHADCNTVQKLHAVLPRHYFYKIL